MRAGCILPAVTCMSCIRYFSSDYHQKWPRTHESCQTTYTAFMDARAAWREAPTAAAHLEQVRQELASLRQELAVADRQMDEATRTMHRLARDPVWSKNSCSLTLVVFQQPPKPFVALHWTLTLCLG